MNFRTLIRTARRWYYDTPERALDRAYDAALTIKAIEDKHFGGKPVDESNATGFSGRAVAYFQAEVRDTLKTARMRLTEFRASRSVMPFNTAQRDRRGAYDLADEERDAVIAEKLNFIDEIIARYEPPPALQTEPEQSSVALIPVKPGSQPQPIATLRPDAPRQREAQRNKPRASSAEYAGDDRIGSRPGNARNGKPNKSERMATEKTGVLPRSLLRTLNRVRRELDDNPNIEEEVVESYRTSRTNASVSIRFLLLLIIIPLLAHQLLKIPITYVVNDRWDPPDIQTVFLNRDIEEEAFVELQHFRERLEFRELIGISNFSAAERDAFLRKEAGEIADRYSKRGAEAIANIFADFGALVAFALVAYVRREDIAVVKTFIDSIIYGLSDSAKAFLIILFTDMFVGFHSPHGWEIILESVSRHFGVADSREFNFLFIATFPVILDTILKYWIFRYLNRISPSAVATYRNMNE
ncbi:CemA family [Rubidibacter lacunae KORDI 51-2]|uniref:Proton extrusion protein PxcA n=1 Tax=Rubidibacter lacunae KORDI 51-2 TaxID=582515 RepID=U5DM22_9CHRO|nr:proton extrusion protein PcxA [Rubidibacter lacunae]ERN41937.1 CemA family [Rubidibacter lacunae KORDI 51-2]